MTKTDVVQTDVIAGALRTLAQLMDSDDGVASAALYQAAARLEEQAEEIERLRAVIKILERDVATAHTEELRAMSYLAEIRAIVGGDDFPHMVERVRIETQRWKNQHERDSKELRRLCAERDRYRMRLRNLLAHGGNVAAMPFADKILGKLRRFNEQAGDPDTDGVDIGRHWLDLLTQLGLLNRVQKSPAIWELTAQGEDALELTLDNGGENAK